jgi:hypothetical protein
MNLAVVPCFLLWWELPSIRHPRLFSSHLGAGYDQHRVAEGWPGSNTLELYCTELLGLQLLNHGLREREGLGLYRGVVQE